MEKIKLFLWEKIESNDCNPISCLIGAVIDSYINHELSEKTFDSFAEKTIKEFYCDIIDEFPK